MKYYAAKLISEYATREGAVLSFCGDAAQAKALLAEADMEQTAAAMIALAPEFGDDVYMVVTVDPDGQVKLWATGPNLAFDDRSDCEKYLKVAVARFRSETFRLIQSRDPRAKTLH